MIGDFKIISDDSYLIVNEKGTLMKLPKLSGMMQLKLFFANILFGKKFTYKEIETLAKKKAVLRFFRKRKKKKYEVSGGGRRGGYKYFFKRYPKKPKSKEI